MGVRSQMIRQLAMNGDRAAHRLRRLTSALSHRQHVPCACYCTANDSKSVSIGDVSITVKKPNHPELVPVKYLSETLPQTVLRHLRWIMQKDNLGQDVFLIGPPGPLRRNIAKMYLELTQREAEYVALSRDTTESDIKQRREIRAGTAFYIDQCAVRAATDGRVLILEGIEKAERNVLPVLNNLLENREMQLDDGRFLMSPARYDLLLKEHTKEELDEWKIVRVDERFRVIALGLPVPRYQGNPLDPPLRSRFQARDINPLPFKEQLEILNRVSEKLSPERVNQLLSFATTMLTDESSTLGLPDFPIDNLSAAVEIMNAIPDLPADRLLSQLYPHSVMLGKEGQTAVEGALKTFEISNGGSQNEAFISEIHRKQDGATVTLSLKGRNHQIHASTGSVGETSGNADFVSTAYHDQLLTDMMTSHMLRDFCVIGPKGCGKSVLVKQFAELLGYHIEPIMLYQDMTSRDLLQQRSTTPEGDTVWRPSPLVTAALEGSLAVLDGLHRINTGTFASIHRLIHDREISLFDGTKLLRHDRYDAVKAENNLTDEEMKDRGIQRIHPSFRIIALAEPPQVGSVAQNWLTPDLLTMFLYHNMRTLTQEEELHILRKSVSDISKMQTLLDLAKVLRSSSDSALNALSTSLSTRQLQRIARRLSAFPDESLHHVVHKACLERFLPRLARSSLEGALKQVGILSEEKNHSIDSLDRSISCEIVGDTLRIGNTRVPVYKPENKMKVPDVLFYENPQHLAVLEAMLKDFMLGEHLLLVGNQGVGKNKIVDRFLHLLNRPREYLQLHRDTTVQNLTLQPSVQGGIIVYEDSPLVRAVKSGNILVVDEADKAPTHVTCILKTLVESGEMHLSDGRRIVTSKSGLKPSANIIVSHPDFRMIVLANRPGFPFLGNDFFGAMGDIFSAHAVDNPDIESEMSMLRQYGPDVPEPLLRKLVLAFSEMRDMADQGLISYPYSTREVVNMVKHLQKYPNEGLVSVVKNVFDFDMYNKEMQETIVETMHKHGIPVGANPNNVILGKDIALPKFKKVSEWSLQSQGDRRKTRLMSLPVEEKTLKIKGPVRMNQHSFSLDRVEARSTVFTEQEAYWRIPVTETNIVADVAVTKAANRSQKERKEDIIHIATSNPICVYSMQPGDLSVRVLDLYDIFPHMSSTYRPRVKLATLGFPLDQNVILHEEVTNIVLNINTETGELRRLETGSLMEAAAEKLTRTFRKQQGVFKMCSDFAHGPEGLLLFYKQTGQTLDVIEMLDGSAHSVSLPLSIHNVTMPSSDRWLVTEANSYRKYLLTRIPSEREYFLHYISEEHEEEGMLAPDMVAPVALEETLLTRTLGKQSSGPNRVIMTEDTHASLAVGFPDLESSIEVYVSPRDPDTHRSATDVMMGAMTHLTHPAVAQTPARVDVVYLPDTGQVVRALPAWKVPEKVYKEGQKPENVSGFLEVADLANHQLRYIPVPKSAPSSYASWFTSASDANLVLSAMSKDGLVTVDTAGCVRLWETSLSHLDRSIQNWRGMIGDGADQHLQVTVNKEGTPNAEMPKHGKVDPTGNPHVGGNTWAGGTGGRDTAGLGGIGGPYRLDAGHDVHQVSDAQKQAVPEHIRKAAREMGEKAFKQRLQEIQMSEYDAELYESYFSGVRHQVQSLRVILDSLQAKSKERQWLKNKSYGDLDDAKLIEGLTGERNIYKQRGEKEPEMGTPQQKPKLLKLVLDVSGSMYRFNGYDNRLTREMEATLMVMEAFRDYEHKFKYDIIGHSGESHNHIFLKQDKPPKNNKERLAILKTIHAHSQFCLSGDSTLEAAKHAIESIATEEADERFVIVMSDANLDRYGIRPAKFAEVLMSNEEVNAFSIFIGSLGNQANVLQKKMPSGHAFVCMDTKNLPQILQQIFTSTMLK